ncbi:hypothetical protein V6C53_06815 [Desulfocurvibacter africanus]|uniref:hypothetical protein n=1 Tax=Desulfocurvibacter africanus TaxID=873 RepID=UPI0002F07574|nr:hypothetical protein [Desulfocurvibacter africanus]
MNGADCSGTFPTPRHHAGDRERILGAGMNEHIAKPIDFTRLERIISRLTPG